MSAGKVILGVLGGVAAGAILGVLFAPQKGSVTRRKIARKGEDFVEELKDIKEQFNEFVENVSDKISSLDEMAEKAKSKGTEKRSTVHSSNHSH
jgi:gas vesicle protein